MMKTWLLVPLLLSALLLVDCSLFRHNQETAVKTLQAVSVTVDKALTAAADMRVAGKIDDATWNKIASLKIDYEKAMLTAVAAVGGDLNSFAPADVQKTADALVTLILSLTK
jgi:hypothetical protein